MSIGAAAPATTREAAPATPAVSTGGSPGSRFLVIVGLLSDLINFSILTAVGLLLLIHEQLPSTRFTPAVLWCGCPGGCRVQVPPAHRRCGTQTGAHADEIAQ